MYPSAASSWRSGGGLDLFERGMEKKREPSMLLHILENLVKNSKKPYKNLIIW